MQVGSASIEDYNTVAIAEDFLDNIGDITGANVKVFSVMTVTGTFTDGDALTGQTSAATGTLIHVNKAGTQAIIDDISGTFQAEVVQKTSDSAIKFTTTDTGDGVGMLVINLHKTDGTYTDGGTTTLGGLTNESATRTWKITVDSASRHTGMAGTGFVWDPGADVTNGSGVLSSTDTGSIMEWMEITGWEGAFSGGYHGITCGSNLACVIQYNIVHDDAETTTAATVRAIQIFKNSTVTGNIIYNIGDECIIQIDGFGTASIIEQNTCYNYDVDNGGAVGITNSGVDSTGKTRNNIVISGAGSGNNISYDADQTNGTNGCSQDNTICTATGDVTGLTTAIFVSTTNLHLVSGAGVIDTGTTITGAAATDIDGTTRTGTYDIGADEFVAAADVGFSGIRRIR